VTLAPLLGASALLVAALMVATWAASLPLRNAGIVDSVWGPGFALVALLGAGVGGGDPLRRWLLAAMVTLWGVRLSWHITRRNAGRGEDPRYARWRAEGGPRWPLRSLVTVFLLQGAILWTVSLPLQTGATAGAGIRWLEVLGTGVFLAGFLVEALADRQLTRFRADPANRGRVLDTGLWRYSRHPNYFGDALLWWGLWLVGGAATGAWWTVVAPVIMTVLLRYVSGVTLLERGMEERRPGYADYLRRTSPFLPRPPRD
jgi:steroid 5-alpha reductase family enzyme